VSSDALPAWQHRKAAGRGSTIGTALILLIGSLATASVAVVSNGNILMVLVSFVVALVIWAICIAPIRYTLLVVIFFSLALDASGEGAWDSTLAPLGALLAFNLNKSIPLSALRFSGLSVILAFLLAIHVHRRLGNLRTDSLGRWDTPKPLVAALGAAGLGVILSIANGTGHGGDVQMAKNQVQSFLLLLLAGYLSSISLRGMRDYRILAKVIVAAACIKAVNNTKRN